MTKTRRALLWVATIICGILTLSALIAAFTEATVEDVALTVLFALLTTYTWTRLEGV